LPNQRRSFPLSEHPDDLPPLIWFQFGLTPADTAFFAYGVNACFGTFPSSERRKVLMDGGLRKNPREEIMQGVRPPAQ